MNAVLCVVDPPSHDGSYLRWLVMNLPSLSRKNNAHVVLFLAALIFVDISWYRCAAQSEQIPKKIQGKKERKKDGGTSLKEIRLGLG